MLRGQVEVGSPCQQLVVATQQLGSSELGADMNAHKGTVCIEEPVATIGYNRLLTIRCLSDDEVSAAVNYMTNFLITAIRMRDAEPVKPSDRDANIDRSRYNMTPIDDCIYGSR
jgi:hypothetical protein